jgi:ATP-dependent helicase/nuclease subunit B
LRGERYPALLTSLLAGQAVRPAYGSHPRLSIWGPLEARLQHVDTLVLGGLNEGTWPAEVDPGPWLSRPMRADFGLPAPERRVGLAAHDFAQAFCAPKVFLTRATRVEGTPTVPSRWLLRLETFLQVFELNETLSAQSPRWLAWAEALDRPARTILTGPPAPTPPLAARPRRLSVTKVETWMRDPYALYAREVLGLRALDPLDADPGAADLGNLVHAALERFIQAHPTHLPDDPEAALLAIGEAVFAAHGARPGVRAFWWPRFCRIAGWFTAAEAERRGGLTRAVAEAHGSMHLDAPGGDFELTAKADRLDLHSDGTVGIIDYKTGALPTNKAVDLGFAPQLPLEAAIVLAGGFAGIPTGPLAGLEYWRLSGGDPPGEIKPLKDDAADRATKSLDGLRGLVTAFDDPTTPYPAIPRSAWAPRFNDYAHLERVKEWAAGAGAAEDES